MDEPDPQFREARSDPEWQKKIERTLQVRKAAQELRKGRPSTFRPSLGKVG